MPAAAAPCEVHMDVSAEALQQAAACQYHIWYPQYTRHAIKSVLIPLPGSVEQFLQEDGIVLEDNTTALPVRTMPTTIAELSDSDDDAPHAVSNGIGHTASPPGSPGSVSSDHTAASNHSSDDADPLPWSERCKKVWEQIVAALQQLGPVAPTLNWSSPSDAAWVSNTRNLKCCSPDEVLLLLKSSDRIQHDLDLLQQLRQLPGTSAAACPTAATSSTSLSSTTTASAATTPDGLQPSRPQQHHPAVLVLREWYDLRPDCELRCFVQQHQVVAVCQRDMSQHFPQLQGQQQRLAAAAVAAHRRCIGSSFPLSSYVVDLYLAPSGASRILNFAPICSTTSPLLFSWEELPYTHMHAASSRQQEHATCSHSSSDPAPEAAAGLTEAANHATARPPEPADSPASHPTAAAATAPEGQQAKQVAVCRIVEQPGMVQPGRALATAMPFDMLHMQDSLDAMIGAMQQQQQ